MKLSARCCGRDGRDRWRHGGDADGQYGLERPIEPPFLIGASGPKGEAVALDLHRGGRRRDRLEPDCIDWSVWLAFGTGASTTASIPTASVCCDRHRVRRSPTTVPLPAPTSFDVLPGAERASIEAVDPAFRHLENHRGHLTELNRHDRAVMTGPIAVEVSRSAAAHWRVSAAVAAAGATEVVFQWRATISAVSCGSSSRLRTPEPQTLRTRSVRGESRVERFGPLPSGAGDGSRTVSIPGARGVDHVPVDADRTGCLRLADGGDDAFGLGDLVGGGGEDRWRSRSGSGWIATSPSRGRPRRSCRCGSRRGRGSWRSACSIAVEAVGAGGHDRASGVQRPHVAGIGLGRPADVGGPNPLAGG